MDHRIDHLRSLLRDDPGSRRFFLLGDLLRKNGEMEEAEKILSEGLEHHPRYVAAWVSLGRLQLETAQYSQAERSFARALELDPENAVAARLIGETAERIEEWVRAIKAYKLARALSPRDSFLEERIDAIENRLAGGPDELKPDPMEEPFAGASQPVPMPEASSEADPFPLGASEPELLDVPEAPPVIQRPREVISVSEVDPFSTGSTGNTGIWMVSDDVFAPPQEPDATTEADVFGIEEPDEAVSPEFEEPVEEAVEEIEESPEPVFVSEPEPLPEPAPELEPPAISEPIEEPPPSVDAAETRDDVLLPTVTLARLALEQGDEALAEETLKAILDRDPGNDEALNLLKRIEEGSQTEGMEASPDEPSVTPADLLAAKAQGLRVWMESLREASERRAP
jgi:tetratricopeptide (TPR) repeat protein